MNANPKELLDTMLGHLDFSFEIKEFPNDKGLTLQVYSPSVTASSVAAANSSRTSSFF